MEIRHADLQIEVEDAEDGGVLLTIIFFFGLRRPCPLGRGGSKPSSFHRLI